MTLSTTDAKRATLNGATLAAAEQLRREVATLVFTPDRLTIVKGGPAARRAYFDRVARAAAAGPRAAGDGLRRQRLRNGTRRSGARARASRRATRSRRGPSASQRSAPSSSPLAGRRSPRSGRDSPRSRGRARSSRRGARLRGRAADRRRARSAAGSRSRPRDDGSRARICTTFGSLSGDRDLRGFGSQGEQRLTVLSLLLAEAALIARAPRHSAAAPPRRRALRARPVAAPRARGLVGTLGQTVITATQRSALPVDPAQLLEVTRGGAGSLWNASVTTSARSSSASATTARSARSRRCGRPRSASRSRGTPGRRASGATARCTSTRARRRGRSSSRSSSPTFARGSATPRRGSSASRRDRLPEHEPSVSEQPVPAAVEPSAEDADAGARIAAAIEDEMLRKLVARAAAASLAKARTDRSF